MKIDIIEISGFFPAAYALRLPFKGKAKSDTVLGHGIGPKDLALMSALVKQGDEHAKVVRGIIVSCSITAPRYVWQEIDTYRVGTDRLSSESTMHSEAKGLSGEKLQEAKGNIKESLEQERVQIFSYQTLRRIYFQRRSHRLPEWKVFCNWIKTLPYAEELITIEDKVVKFNENELKAITEMLNHCGQWSEENLGVPIKDIKSAYEKIYPGKKVTVHEGKIINE